MAHENLWVKIHNVKTNVKQRYTKCNLIALDFKCRKLSVVEMLIQRERKIRRKKRTMRSISSNKGGGSQKKQRIHTKSHV